jgi:hypothetical protein
MILGEVSDGQVCKANVGRMAERIAANELESRGFHVTDLNRDGIKANADLLAAKGGKTWQIQVKGSTWDQGWWFNYGFCNESLIADKTLTVFNRADSFYKAQIVLLVCVKSPIEYVCVVMPTSQAETAAQLNLDLFRMKKDDGSAKKPGKMWCDLDHIPQTKSKQREAILRKEQQIIKFYKNAWNRLSD